MPFTSFSNDASDSKAEVVELNVRAPKFLALERGDGDRFLQETNFSSTESEYLTPPSSPPLVNCAIQDLQEKLI